MTKLFSNFQLERYGIHVRLVNESDADFIVKLRTDSRLGRYIHQTSENVELQKKWIRDYKKREADGLEYYFVFSFQGEDCGVARLYDIKGVDFVSGSWVFSPSAPVGVSILGSILTKEIAYEFLHLENDYADMRKENKSVVRFNMSFEPEILREDEENIYVKFDRTKFEQHKKKHIKLCMKVLGLK